MFEAVNRRAERELEAFPRDLRAEVLTVVAMLTAKGPQHVGMPHVRPVRDKLWEIRARAASGIGRVLYTVRPGQRVVMLRAFVKKTRKTPKRDVEIALLRLRERT